MIFITLLFLYISITLLSLCFLVILVFVSKNLTIITQLTKKIYVFTYEPTIQLFFSESTKNIRLFLAIDAITSGVFNFGSRWNTFKSGKLMLTC